MLIMLDPDDLKLVDEALQTMRDSDCEYDATRREILFKHIDDVRAQIANRLATWRSGVDIAALKQMVDVGAITRDEARTILARKEIVFPDWLRGVPATTIRTSTEEE
jgi:hypothetical protein